ncbi:MAG: DUF11 domain-containing protein [Bacteroidales bacterium]|nr:DUF11 domain-containing protein [Bacteroidales bacterium]
MKMRNIQNRINIILIATLLGLFSVTAFGQSTGGAKTVDGDQSDWNLTESYFADMYRAFKPDKVVQSKLYLHYDCAQELLYILVLAEDGYPGLKYEDDAWLDITDFNGKEVTGGSGNDGTAPDFSWLEEGFDGDANHVKGWEAVIALAPGSYKLIAHLEVFGDGAKQTSGTDKKTDKDGIVLTISCPDEDIDIEVNKKANDYYPYQGSVVTFTMEASNLSSSVDATSIIIEEILPAGLDYLSHSTTGGTYNSASGLWTISELTAGATVELTLEARVTTDEEVCNTIAFISADQNDEFLKNNKFTMCLKPKNSDTDLGVTKDVYNAVPKVGEQSLFTITVTNMHNDMVVTGVEITDQLDANLALVEAAPSIGTYNAGTGIWSIASLNPGQTATMLMTVTVNGSADNFARLTKLDQNDINPDNDEAMASVTVSGSSGGNDGGLESDGSLASLIAERNFSKGKSDAKKAFNSSELMIGFSESLAKQGIIAPVSNLKSVSDLVEYIPENGPFGTRAYISTPGDLLGISNANEVFSADYFDADNKRMAAIMGLTTNDGEVYNHTKVICDRLTGANLEFVRYIQINEHPFIISKLVQASGDIDYAISFIVYDEDNSWTIDNRWHKEDYQVPQESEIFNFQIWSATPQSTVELMESVISMLGTKKSVTYKNINQPDVPTIIVEKGNYASGSLILDILNPSGIGYVKVKGSLTRFENASRETFEYTLQVNKGNDGRHQVEIPSGYVFDIDFSIGSADGGKRDGLYFADGPWSKDFDRDGAAIYELTREMHDGSSFADAYLLERNVRMQGEVRTYASMFRMLKPGNLPVDLTQYKALVFEGSGSGEIELVIAKSSIDNWGEQYRLRFSLSSDEKTYSIDLSQLKSIASNQPFSADDVQSITFTFHGDGMNYSNFDISVKNLRFSEENTITPDQTNLTDFGMNVYPNPMQRNGFVEFSLPTSGDTRIALYNMAGQEVVEILNEELNEGNHRIPVYAANADNGVYFLRMIFNHQVETKRVNLVR